VLCTHLHVDHVGWNTRLVNGKWVPTFPNARYLFGRKEWEHWSSEQALHRDGDVMGDSVRPIIDAGLAELVDMDQALTPECGWNRRRDIRQAMSAFASPRAAKKRSSPAT